MKTVAITGASGFVGQNLSRFFSSMGYKVRSIKRDELSNPSALKEVVENSDIIFNLAGANIISRWSDSYKKTLHSSRIETTKALVGAMQIASKKPELLISTSAIGIYSNTQIQTEKEHEYADDFLAQLCHDWEAEALKAQEHGVRVALFRFGIVLGDGGALEKMLPPFKLGIGGVIGDGSQALSFIHIDDLINAYRFVVENKEQEGIYNLVSPTPTTNRGLTKSLGKILHRPTFLPLPEFVLELIFGEGSKVLTDGQSVLPQRLLENGFEFAYKDIDSALKNLLR